MKASTYRAKVEKELAAQPDQARAAAPLRAAALTGQPLDLESRRDLVRQAVGTRADLPTAIPTLIAILADPTQPEPLRGSALASLKAAAFVVTAFAPYRAEFIAALHKLLPEANAELRQRAIEVLAAEKDPEAQALLVKGLQDPSAALVPPAVALQYLSYDDHGSYIPVVRELVRKTDDDQVREEGLRLLASDPESRKLFQDLLADKDEKSAVRRLSAVALQALDPAKFEKAARKIVNDDKDFDEIRATALGALTHVKDYARTRADTDFAAQVGGLQKSASGVLRAAAAQFVKRTE